jgi:hypothetical protein
MIDLSERQAFQHKVCQRCLAKPVDYSLYSAQVPQALLAYVSDQPEVAWQRNFT